jgi:dienelactone hydrolase
MQNLIGRLGIITLIAIGVTFTTGSVSAGERCSPLSGRCFEWPLVPNGTTLEKISTSGVWSKPEGNGPFPAIIIAESCGGSKPAVDEMWPAFFNSLGYATYTPRILDEFGERYCPDLRFVASNSNRTKMLRILYSAMDDIHGKKYAIKSSIGIIGFSLGGILIRDAGEIKDLKSPGGNKFKYAINVYGNCTLLERQGDNIPTLMLLAERDTAKGKHKMCEKVQGQRFENMSWHIIKDAYHAFDDDTQTSGKTDVGGNTMKYSKDATNEAKDVIRNFLEKVK